MCCLRFIGQGSCVESLSASLPSLFTAQSLDEFDNFVRLDDELALLRIKLRPKANNIADLTGDSDYKRMVELRDQLDTKRKIYGMDTRRGQQPAHIVENFHKR